MSKTPFDEYEVVDLKPGGHWRNSFDSRYLRHFWLAGKPRIVTIVKVQELHSKSSKTAERKTQQLITLAEADKPWAANVTNCGLIEMLSGESDPVKWPGLKIELYPTKTTFGGKMVDCIRVRDRLPEQGAKTEKPQYRQEVSAYVSLLKAAENAKDLSLIEDKLADDNELTQEETQKILGWMRKTAEKLTPKDEKS